jgi:hypothetical protein
MVRRQDGQTLSRCKKFIADHKDALRRWCAAARDVVFPVDAANIERSAAGKQRRKRKR